jgi:hypothetical protein
VLGLCLSLLLTAPFARAEQAEPAELVATYHADASCPDRAEFTRRVRARLTQGAGAKHERFEVSLVRGQAGVRGRLTLVGHETGSARTLTAASCEEAVDALALVAALMLRELVQPAASSPPAPVAAGNASGRAAPRATATAAAASAEQAPDVSSEAAPSTDPEPTAAQETAHESDRPRAEDGLTPVPTEPPGAVHAARFSRPRLALFATGLAVWSVSPNVRPGLGLGLALSAAARRGLGLSALLGLRATLPDLIESEQGRAQFVWVAGMSALCIESPERFRLRAGGCGVLELGAIRASGASATAHADSRFWGALGPSLFGALSVHPRVALRLGGELLGVLVLDRFFLADQLVFSVPSLAYRLELALQITIL